MLIFPQLSTGASAQYPIRKKRSDRTIQNISEDGRVISLSDLNAGRIQWSLSYVGLTDAELGSLTAFYELCEGSLQSFLFLDPTANLFSYSEDFLQAAWVKSSLLSVSESIDDPLGTNRASRLTNTSAASLAMVQTGGVPGIVQCTFSAYLRSVAGPINNCQMARTDGSTVQTDSPAVGASWQRFALSGAFASSISDTCDFSVTLAAGSALDVFGLQLDAQPFGGTYISTTSETGIHPNSRFDSAQFRVTSTGPGESSLSFSVVSEASSS